MTKMYALHMIKYIHFYFAHNVELYLCFCFVFVFCFFLLCQDTECKMQNNHTGTDRKEAFISLNEELTRAEDNAGQVKVNLDIKNQS